MREFEVSGMQCGHCVAAVTRAVQQADAAAVVTVDLPAGLVRVDSALAADHLLAAIAGAGFDAVPRAMEPASAASS